MSDNQGEDDESVRAEIAELEHRLQHARSRLSNSTASAGAAAQVEPAWVPHLGTIGDSNALHALLLISDSALPLGTFAFSSGLESCLAHRRLSPSTPPLTPIQCLDHFLHLSLSSLASTSLPFLLTAHREPQTLPGLTDSLDATLTCPVVRRASVAQGKALLTIYERSFSQPSPSIPTSSAATALSSFHTLLRSSSSPDPDLPTSPHYAPLFGVLCAHLSLPLSQTAYVFLHSHVRAVLSAAVRASVCGPYHAQSVLASPATALSIQRAIDRSWHVHVSDAGQDAPVLDLWGGRHELLYSRIFNS